MSLNDMATAQCQENKTNQHKAEQECSNTTKSSVENKSKVESKEDSIETPSNINNTSDNSGTNNTNNTSNTDDTNSNNETYDTVDLNNAVGNAQLHGVARDQMRAYHERFQGIRVVTSPGIFSALLFVIFSHLLSSVLLFSPLLSCPLRPPSLGKGRCLVAFRCLKEQEEILREHVVLWGSDFTQTQTEHGRQEHDDGMSFLCSDCKQVHRVGYVCM